MRRNSRNGSSFDPDIGAYIGENTADWYATARNPRASRDGGMRTRGPVGKVSVSYHRPTRDRLRKAAAQRDAALRAAREGQTGVDC